MIFERLFGGFAADAREGVVAAVEEARELGHDSVGEEDLLLGVLRVDGSVAAEALSSLGVTLEAAREESERMTVDALCSVGISLEEIRREAGDAFEMRLPEVRRIPFSPRAKEALGKALREARRLGDDRLAPEHVLRGVLGVEDGSAVRLLSRMGVSSEQVVDRLDGARR